VLNYRYGPKTFRFGERQEVSPSKSPKVPSVPDRAVDPEAIERAKAVLALMRSCLEQLDGLEARRFGVAAAHLSHAIDSVNQVIGAADRR
jgi:hypothetical protein